MGPRVFQPDREPVAGSGGFKILFPQISMWYVQDDSVGNVNIFGDYSVKVRMNMHLILNGYLFGSSNLTPLDFFLVGWLQSEVYTKKQTNKGGHTRRIARSHSASCNPHKET